MSIAVFENDPGIPAWKKRPLDRVAELFMVLYPPDFHGMRKGNCPFDGCGSSTFTVYLLTGVYQCFRCRAGGDVVEFVRRIGGLEYRQAMDLLERMLPMERTLIPVWHPVDADGTGDIPDR